MSGWLWIVKGYINLETESKYENFARTCSSVGIFLFYLFTRVYKELLFVEWYTVWKLTLS